MAFYKLKFSEKFGKNHNKHSLVCSINIYILNKYIHTLSGREGNKYIPKIERNKKEFIMKKKNVTDKHQPCIQLYIDQLSVRQFCFCSFFFLLLPGAGVLDWVKTERTFYCYYSSSVG